MHDVADLVSAIVRLENKFINLADANNDAHQKVLIAIAKLQTEMPVIKGECESSKKRIDDVEEDLDTTKERISGTEKDIAGINSKIKILLSILIPAILSAGSIITASILK